MSLIFNWILLHKIRCRKLLIQVLVKFPFSQISRFGLKREKVPKGNLKAKTGKSAKREFKS